MLCFVVCIFSCKQKEDQKMQNGLKYVIHSHQPNSRKIETGDYLTVIMLYKNDKDSVLYDSRVAAATIRFQLDRIPFQGSFEEGLTLLSEGDSATFFVSADSMYQNLFVKKGSVVPQEQTAFKKGTAVRFDLKIVQVQDYVSAEQEIEMHLSAKEKIEKETLKKYIEAKQIKEQPDSSGFYLFIKEKGKGNKIDSGKVVTVEYEGRFLDGTIYDGTKKGGQAYSFMFGAHHVISGWELAMKQLHEGDKISLLLPSKLAYGEEGIKNPRTGKVIVPSYSPLVFDIEIKKVEEMPSVTGR